jgi:cytochrome c oxidase subunit 2
VPLSCPTTVRVRVVPEKAGRFAFLCDNFCGDGHEHMAG